MLKTVAANCVPNLTVFGQRFEFHCVAFWPTRYTVNTQSTCGGSLLCNCCNSVGAPYCIANRPGFCCTQLMLPCILTIAGNNCIGVIISFVCEQGVSSSQKCKLPF